MSTQWFPMNSPGRSITIAAGVFGMLGVALGAFGAHALRPTLEAHGRIETWQTAVLYHLVHAVALLAIARRDTTAKPPTAGLDLVANAPQKDWRASIAWCWSLGVVLFSGSLYWLALGGPRFLGPVTPIGGTFFIIGWVIVIVSGLKR